MRKKGQAGVVFGVIGLIIAIIIAVINIPQIQIQTKDINSLSVSNNKVTIRDVVVWNKGGTIGGNLFFTPDVCIYGSVNNNITCIHNGYSSDSPCNNGVCGTVNAGELSQKDIFNLQLPNENVNNFTLNITAKGYVSIITIAKDSISLNCSINKTNKKYDCVENQ